GPAPASQAGRTHGVACDAPSTHEGKRRYRRAAGDDGSRPGYESAGGRKSQPSAPTAMTASVRLLTLSAFRMAVTWFFTVGSARSRVRQIALLLLPCIIRARTSTWRSVRPRSRGERG